MSLQESATDTNDALDTGHIIRYTKHTHEELLKVLCEKYGERFTQYRDEWDKIIKSDYETDFPLCMAFELDDVCNLKCQGCYRAHAKDTSIRLGLDRFKKIIDEASANGIPSIKFGTSEPLMTKNFDEYLRYARKKGIMDIFITTNGLLLNDKISDAIFETDVSRLRVSIDAATPETYKAIRGGKLEILERNLNRFLERRAQAGRVLPLVRVSFITMDENKHEIEAFREKWFDKVDYIEFQDCLDFSRVDNIEEIDVPDFECPLPRQYLTVRANGNIQGCCTFFGQNLVMGHVDKVSLSDVWKSKKWEALRDSFKTKKYLPSCKNCFGIKKRVIKIAP